MNVIQQIKEALFTVIKEKFSINPEAYSNLELSLNTDPSKQQFGDLSTNAALILSKHLKINPQVLAQDIKNILKHEYIEKLEIAGPGFINIFFTQDAFKNLAYELFEQGESFFRLSSCPPSFSCLLEFVSANPTGPLHIGHGRGGIIGDVLGNILKFIGYRASKEYYINDAGAQIQKLGISFKIRCMQQLGNNIELPEDAYHGQYLIDLAKHCIEQYGNELLNKPDNFFAQYAKDTLLVAIEDTLKKYGITFDVWFSELDLHTSDAITQAIEILNQRGYIYEKEGALWFKSTEFGDDKDRVVKKSSGELTYVAADIAYLQNKINRGYDNLIMVLGQDHHSYVVRLKAVMEALGYDPNRLNVILYQLVTLKESGTLLRMSKRAGNIVTLQDVINSVGTDVARFFYLNKKADAHLDFDIDLALKKTDENPVYYIQYAYVRSKSILEKAHQENVFHTISSTDSAFITYTENLLIKKIASLKQLLESISTNYHTHLLAYYVIELAQTFHSYYNFNKVIDMTNIDQSRGRLFMTLLIHRTLKTCFDLLGINAPERM